MKKLFALLIALMMAFSCVSALAEEPTESQLPSIQLPNFTVAYDVNIDEEQMMNLITSAAGQNNALPEESVGVIQLLVSLLNGLGEKIVFADNGIQYDLSIKGQDALFLVAEMTETGFAVASNLVPSYVLTLQQATIQKLIEQAMSQFQNAGGKLDKEQIQKAAEKLMGYAMETVGSFQSLVTFGEPVKGTYNDVINGVEFNTEIPLSVDVNGMIEASKQLIGKALADEDIKAAIDSITAMIPGASFDPAEILSQMENASSEAVPTVTGKVYAITDDEGKQAAPDTYVIVNAEVEGQPEGNTTTRVYVAENALNITVDVPAQNVSLQIYGYMLDNGVTGNIAVSAQGTDIEIVGAVTTTEDGGLNVDEAVFVNEAELPLMTCNVQLSMGGERTRKAFDGEKTELPIEGLMDAENSANVSGALLMDVITNGLSDIVNNIKTAAPEQGAMLEQIVGGLVSSMMGGAVEAPAE